MSRFQPHLGIMVEPVSRLNPPFIEQKFYRFLSQLGQQKQWSVTVFSPLSIDWDKQLVYGYQWQKNKWQNGVYPIPNIIYDRIFYGSNKQMRRLQPTLKRLREKHQALFLGRGLPGKWKVYRMLQDQQQIKPYLPPTHPFGKAGDWASCLRAYSSLFLKPSSGSHGKGVMKISREEAKQQFKVEGRTYKNQPFTKLFLSQAECYRWLRRQIKNRSYILQPFLALTTTDETPFDLRLLLQKDKNGKWQETGRAVRIGKKNGLTSNLHGGGRAMDADSFMNSHYTSTERKTIEKQIQAIATSVPQHLEKKHGPLVELGLDLGIDLNRKVWLLEVNSKPGRQSFLQCADSNVFRQSMSAPMEYADYVFRTMKGGGTDGKSYGGHAQANPASIS